MRKSTLSTALRQAGLIGWADRLRYAVEKWKHRKANSAFKAEHPELSLPPDYLLYESYQMNHRKYYEGGLEHAQFIRKTVEKHLNTDGISILDWGCGPGRVVRHFPKVFPINCSFFGTDYNQKSIAWCSEHIGGVSFNCNGLEAKLPYTDNQFGLIHGHSVLTHLSEKMHFEWIAELKRVLGPDGVLYITTQGDNYTQKLNEVELAAFARGELVVRGKTKEGHRTYSAFHPVAFMHKLLSDMEILEHITFTPKQGYGLPQDIWLVRKKHT